MERFLLDEEAFVGIQEDGEHKGAYALFLRFGGDECSCTICNSRGVSLEYTGRELASLIRVFDGDIVFSGSQTILEANQHIIFGLIDFFPKKFFQVKIKADYTHKACEQDRSKTNDSKKD